MARLFAYGTLLDDETIRGILGRVPRSRAAVLRGFRRTTHPGSAWPATETDPAAQIPGRVLEGLSEGELERLDRHEGVADGLYRRVAAKVEVGSRRFDAFLYVKV